MSHGTQTGRARERREDRDEEEEEGKRDRHTEYWHYLTSFGCVLTEGSLLALLSNLSFLKVWEENKYGPPQRAGAGFKKEKKFRKS